MEEEGIGLVLARATELRSKIIDCIHKVEKLKPKNQSLNDTSVLQHPKDGNVEEEDEEETERLFSICDALETLESQLSSLQAMQQNQCYEREAALAEIDYGRKILLDKLKEYKGKDLAVIQEASAFAGETAGNSNDLMLPPYPSRPPSYLSNFSSSPRSERNGKIYGVLDENAKKNLNPLESNPAKGDPKNQRPRLGRLIGAAAGTVVTLVGVITIMNLAGFRPMSRLVKGDNPFNILSMFLNHEGREDKPTIQCPPGKVLVVEDGVARCLVKERVEVPFKSGVATPDVDYGCG